MMSNQWLAYRHIFRSDKLIIGLGIAIVTQLIVSKRTVGHATR